MRQWQKIVLARVIWTEPVGHRKMVPFLGLSNICLDERPGLPVIVSGAVGPNERVRGMLVLTRKTNQSIMIGDDVEVSVLSVVGEKVRIGIQAPPDVPVFRTEIYIEIQRQQGEGQSREDVRSEVDDAIQGLGEKD
jgi:carbon storage regulator